MTIQDYTEALLIAQDRATRGNILMYIFHLYSGGYYITSQYEYPFVNRNDIIKVDEIWPNPKTITQQIDWTDL